MDEMICDTKAEGITQRWKSIKRELDVLAALPQYSKPSAFLLNLANLFRAIGVVCGGILAVVVILSFILVSGFLLEVSFYVGIVVIVLGYAVIFIKNRIRLLSRRLYDDWKLRFPNQTDRTKQVEQALIEKLRSEVRKNKVDTEKYRFYLHNIDYNHIKALKKPTLLRERYEAVVVA